MVAKKTVIIGHLYPEKMNVYGDMGNIIALRYRLKNRGFGVEYRQLNSLKNLTASPVDILVGGGGQDSNQDEVVTDLLKYGSELKAQCKDGLTCIMVCGMYQLFGHYFLTSQGKKIKGAGILDVYTEGGASRMIGNVKTHSSYGTLIGFENHSGNTYLSSSQMALGTVYQGHGNNMDKDDKSEGALTDNVFGTYLHGPILPKNPKLADDLILRALNKKYGINELDNIHDDLEHKTAEHIRKLTY